MLLPLYQRTQLPPDRAGIAKPPYELADRSGQIQFGQTVAGVAEDITDSIIKAKAANEVHEFYGTKDISLTQWDNYVEQNPNASMEDVEAERQKILSQISLAGQKAKTGIAKRDINNWLLANKTVLEEMTKGTQQAIQSNQERTKFEAYEKLYIAEGKDKELIDLYQRMTGEFLPIRELNENDFQIWYGEQANKTGINPNPDDPNHKYDYRAAYMAEVEPSLSPEDGKYHWPSQFEAGVDTKAKEGTPLIDPEIGAIRLKTGLAVIRENQQKVILERAKGDIEQRAVDIAAVETQKAIADGKSESEARKTGYAAAFDWMDDPRTAKEYIDLVPLKDQQAVWEDVKGRVSYRKAQSEEIARDKANSDVAEIQNRLREKDISGLESVIRDSSLPETGENSKEHWYGVLDKTVEAIEKGDKLPINKSDPVTEAAIMAAIDAGDEKITPEYINSFIANGLSGGVDGTAQKLIEKLKTADNPRNRWRNAITSTGTAYLKDLEQSDTFGDKNTPESSELLAHKQLQWQAWRQEHPDANQEESEAYIRDLTKTERRNLVKDSLLERGFNLTYNIIDLMSETDRDKAKELEKQIKKDTEILTGLTAREQLAKSQRRYAPQAESKKSEPFQKGQKVTKNGVTYIYKGNGEWEY